MRPTAILIILLLTLFSSCSKDDDFDPNQKYDWEILYHSKYYAMPGYEGCIETHYSTGHDTIRDMTRSEVEAHINKNYTNQDCTFAFCKREAIGSCSYYEETHGEIKRIK